MSGSPSVRRMICVLNFFLEHPQQSFTVAQVVKSLKLNRATCHSIITGLAEERYLFRNSDKTYVLGPAIFAISRKSALALSALDIAKYEMRDLADRLDVVVSAHFLENGEVTSRARAASSSNLKITYPSGMGYPLHPWGIVFLAPLAGPQLEDALDHAQPPLSKEQKEAERKQVAFVRQHGYIFAIDNGQPRVSPLRSNVEARGVFITELESDRLYPLLFLSAPVLDEKGQVAFQLVLSAFNGDYTGQQIEVVGREVVQSSNRISSFITGN
jgi:DNA-binding IclR family transcriptional regulator